MEKQKKQNKQKKVKKRRRCTFFYDFVKATGALTTLIYVRPKLIYESKLAKKKIRGRAVVIANHIGMLDPLAVHCAFYYRRLFFLTLHEIFGKRIGKWFFSRMNCIPVNRENFEMKTFRECLDALEEERMLVIFPEGAINEQPEIQTVAPFKAGSILIAVRGKAPIIPLYMVKRKKWWQRSVCVIGEPIDAVGAMKNAYNLDTVNELSERLREKEIDLKGIYDLWKAKKLSK